MKSLTQQMSADVREFMIAFDQPFFPTAEATPCEVSTLRSSLIKEEEREFNAAPVHSVDELDAICDLLYVTVGTALTVGVDIAEYRSGQLALSYPAKQSIWNVVLPVTQDLDSRFPCTRIQQAGLNAIVRRMIDVGALMGYKMREAFAEVHRSNMTKLHNGPHPETFYKCTKKGDKWLVKRADGKVVKPATFQPPNLLPYL